MPIIDRDWMDMINYSGVYTQSNIDSQVATQQIASTGISRNETILSEEVLEQIREMIGSSPYIILPETLSHPTSYSMELVKAPSEEITIENSEELDAFLDEFAPKKEVC